MNKHSKACVFMCGVLLPHGLILGHDAEARNRDHERLVSTVFISEANYTLVMTAKKVTACELNSDPLMTRPPNAKVTYVEGKPLDVPPEILAALREELKQPGAYVLPTGGDRRGQASFGCIPNYGIRVRFTSDSQSLDVNFCFGCSDIALSRGGKIFHEAQFKTDNTKFLNLCRRLFPDNKELKNFESRQRNALAPATP